MWKIIYKKWDLSVKMWRTKRLLFGCIPIYKYTLCKDGKNIIVKYSIICKLKK